MQLIVHYIILALKKIALTDEQILGAITTLDIATLNTEYIDLLANVVPNEQEVKAFNNYESGGKPLAALSPTDRFMIRVSICRYNLLSKNRYCR